MSWSESRLELRRGVPLEKPKELSTTDKEVDELSQVVLQLVNDHKLREEDASQGKIRYNRLQ